MRTAISEESKVLAEAALGKLKGVEDKAWVRVEGSPRVYAIADEDLER